MPQLQCLRYNSEIMNARFHTISGGIAASLLIPVLGVNSVFFWASSVLIDGDHYLDYLYHNRFKNFSVKRMFEFHRHLFRNGQRPNFLGLNIMHTAEALLLVYAVSALTGWLWLKAVLWGMLFHMLVDVVYLYFQGRLFRRALSVIEYAIRWRRMKRRGLQPELPYTSALQLMFGTPQGQVGESDHQD